MKKLSSSKQIQKIVAGFPQIWFRNGGKYQTRLVNSVTRETSSISRISWETEESIIKACQSLTLTNATLSKLKRELDRDLERLKTASIHMIQNEDFEMNLSSDDADFDQVIKDLRATASRRKAAIKILTEELSNG